MPATTTLATTHVRIRATYPAPTDIDPAEYADDLTDLLASEGFSDITVDEVDGEIDLVDPNDDIPLAAGQLPWEQPEPRGWGDRRSTDQQELSSALEYCRKIGTFDG